MTTSPFPSPLILDGAGGVERLCRVPLSSGDYDEAWLQDLVFEHPQCLPVQEIEPGFQDLVPICRELRTPVGPLDVLFCTPRGQLCVVEVKLWRNPEARRKVVGQVLDYATELSRWAYEDLQREVSRATGQGGNALYEMVAARHPDVDEARFVDSVSRSLSAGDFLLLVVGDGIREGVGRIAEYLRGSSTLGFTFGLVEMAIHQTSAGQTLVQPRVLANTVVVQRTVVSVDDARLSVTEDSEDSASEEDGRIVSEAEAFYEGFWSEFVSQLVLDDVDQPMAKPNKRGAIFFPLPPSGGKAWITVYFLQSKRSVGVFFTLMRGDFADLAFSRLSAEAAEIDAELGVPVEWTSEDGKHSVWCSATFDDLRAVRNRDEIKGLLSDRLNRFVNAFRPRMARIVEEIG